MNIQIKVLEILKQKYPNIKILSNIDGSFMFNDYKSKYNIFNFYKKFNKIKKSPWYYHINPTNESISLFLGYIDVEIKNLL